MVVQVTRGIFPLMLSLFLAVSSPIWPLTPAVSSITSGLPAATLPARQPDGVCGERGLCHVTCHPVETTICSGHCITKDPVIKIPYSKVYQHVCTYRDFYYKTFELPDCPSGVDPMVTYPVALSCHCSRCAMDTSDCTFESLQPDFCTNDIPFYY